MCKNSRQTIFFFFSLFCFVIQAQLCVCYMNLMTLSFFFCCVCTEPLLYIWSNFQWWQIAQTENKKRIQRKYQTNWKFVRCGCLSFARFSLAQYKKPLLVLLCHCDVYYWHIYLIVPTIRNRSLSLSISVSLTLFIVYNFIRLGFLFFLGFFFLFFQMERLDLISQVDFIHFDAWDFLHQIGTK